MSFRCGFCGTVTQPRVKQVLITTEVRERSAFAADGGQEIVKQLPACPSCAAQHGVTVVPRPEPTFQYGHKSRNVRPGFEVVA